MALRTFVLLVVAARAVQLPGKRSLQALERGAVRGQQDPIAGLGDLFNQAKASAAAAAQSIVNQASDAVEQQLRNNSHLIPFANQLAHAVDSVGNSLNNTLHNARGNITDTLGIDGLVNQTYEVTKSVVTAVSQSLGVNVTVPGQTNPTVADRSQAVGDVNSTAAPVDAAAQTVIVVAEPPPPPVVTHVKEYGSLVRANMSQAERAALEADLLSHQAEESASIYVRAVVNATFAAETAAKSLQSLSEKVGASVEATKQTAKILDDLLRSGDTVNASILDSAKAAENAAMEAVEAAGLAARSAAEKDRLDLALARAKEANLDDVVAIAAKVNETVEASRRAARALEEQAGSVDGLAPAALPRSAARSDAVDRHPAAATFMAIIAMVVALAAAPR